MVAWDEVLEKASGTTDLGQYQAASEQVNTTTSLYKETAGKRDSCSLI